MSNTACLLPETGSAYHAQESVLCFCFVCLPSVLNVAYVSEFFI